MYKWERLGDVPILLRPVETGVTQPALRNAQVRVDGIRPCVCNLAGNCAASFCRS